jgi:hypothetical protein
VSEYINGTTDILGGSVIRYALNTTTPNQAVIRKIIAGNGISISSTGVDAGTGDVTISIDTTGSGGSGGNGSGGNGTPTGVGTVTSVNMIAPEGMFIEGAPITTAGTISLILSSGYVIPLSVDVQQGKTAYTWGNHALAGYQSAITGTGLVKSTSGVISYITDNSTNWNTAYGWGNHAIVGYLLAEVDNLNSVTNRGNTTTNSITITNLTATALAGSGDRFVIANTMGVLSTATIGSGLSYSGGVLSATGGAAGTVTGSGTAGKIVKFNSASDIGNSIMTESSNLITVAGSVNATSFVKSGGTSSQFLMADGSVTTSTFLTSGSFVSDYDSAITGLRNSTNKVYTLTNSYQTGTTKVYVNGVRYSPGGSNDYTESAANQITFTNAPDSGDLILIDYIKS